MKDHPDSPVRSSEIKLDETRRAYVLRNGVKMRIKTRPIEVKPRVFQKWIEVTAPV